ncbi:hypothetical protein BSQ39_08270 [Loigolactobacillus backii]|uniref:HTH domain-containing protein n=1 Tax=Loigolactobacillus backii TaxID=375175 RepID=UPI000C1CA8BC|nr:HTH domain-containing protein [Loigolactobacillus backii]PIO83558.1 hypothetical protein BSQ39_08270 [Loigolactobacillus backii]
MKELSDEQLMVITKQVISSVNKKNKQKQRDDLDFRLRNTKFLLHNYRYLKANINTDVPEVTIEADDLEDAQERDLKLYSLLKYKAKTKRILMFVDAIIVGYENLCANATETEWRRYMVIKYLYTGQQHLSATKIASRYNVDKRTVYKDCNKAIDELSVMLFGIQAIDTDNVFN